MQLQRRSRRLGLAALAAVLVAGSGLATTPAGAAAAPRDVTVSERSVAARAAAAARPVVTHAMPKLISKRGGAKVKLSGRRLGEVRRVKFGTTLGKIVSRSRSSVVVRAPRHVAGRVHITVQNYSGWSKATRRDRVIYRVGGVGSLQAVPYRSVVSLSWINPRDAAFSGVTIRRTNGRKPPASIGAGRSVAKLRADQTTYTDLGLKPGKTYSYAVFARGGTGNVSARVPLTITTTTSSDPGPLVQPNASTVTADPLPTPQINGVAWTQLIVGNTVFVGGSFTTGRAAGAPRSAGVPRANLLAYNLTTGKLLPIKPNVNGQVLSLAASRNGKVVYLGGDFTAVNRGTHNYIAAISATSGKVLTNFTADAGDTVRALAVSGPVVYLGGDFQAVNGSPRARLAAVDAKTGALTTWRPQVGGGSVYAMTLTPDKTTLVVGGNFLRLNGTDVFGSGAVSAAGGRPHTWLMNETLRDYGNNSVLDALTTDGTYVYGGGRSFGPSNSKSYEGVWAANPRDGSLVWVEDCHGDTYSVFGVNHVLYTASHTHECYSLDGWTNSNPLHFRHSMAFTQQPTGLLRNSQPGSGYNDFGGNPSPSIINWFPHYEVGGYTGLKQATWSVTGNSRWLVVGGEFPSVNGQKQEGLVRFALRGTKGNPGAEGPLLSGNAFKPSLLASTDAVALSVPINTDRDDLTLTYRVYRNGAEIRSARFDLPWWQTTPAALVDTGLRPKTTYSYYVTATDPHGLKVKGATATITTQ